MACLNAWMFWSPALAEYPAHMEHFGLLLKSFRGDAGEATRLVASYRKFAPADIPLTAVVPQADLSLFRSITGSDITLIAEEEFAQYLVNEPVAGLRPGYVNQEIIKLAFHELGIYENYFTVDSELEFLRPFAKSDFLAPDGFPYSILVEDRDLLVDPEYFRSYWESREKAHRAIWDVVNVPDPVIRTCHGHTSFSTQVLKSFTADFLEPRGWTYMGAIEFAPYEYTWYNAWLLKSRAIPIHPRDPLVKVFHTEQEFLAAVARGTTRDALARGYLARVINGNFDQGRSIQATRSSKSELLAPYLSYQEAWAILVAKMKSSGLVQRKKF